MIPNTGKILVVDIGSNSIHALFVEIKNKNWNVFERDKELVRLGDGAFLNNKLSEDAMQRALEVLSRVAKRARELKIEKILAVATAVLRTVENGSVFLERIFKETGLPVEIISGEREAFLIFEGARHSLDFGDRTAALVDIGGGSLELVIANAQEPFFMTSLPLGCNRLRQIHPFSDPPKASEVESLRAALQGALRPVANKIRELKASWVVGTAGTVKNLFNVMLHEELVEQDARGEMGIPLSAIENKFSEWCQLSLEQMREVKGLSKKRSDMFRHGVAALLVLMQDSGIDRLSYATKAMREGLIYDYVKRNL